jgi:hypothetical protein
VNGRIAEKWLICKSLIQRKIPLPMSRLLLFFCLPLLLAACQSANSPEAAPADSVSQPSNAAPKPPDSTTQPYETEAQETQRLLQERHLEDEKSFSELDVYDGNYTLYTESEGVNATLRLKYNGDKTFQFNWEFLVADQCSARASGFIQMDRTQHGFYQGKEGFAHVNFMGSGQMGMMVELEWEKRPNGAKGDCNFSGTYTSGAL